MSTQQSIDPFPVNVLARASGSADDPGHRKMALIPIVTIHSNNTVSGTQHVSLKEDERGKGKVQSWLFRDYMQHAPKLKITDSISIASPRS